MSHLPGLIRVCTLRVSDYQGRFPTLLAILSEEERLRANRFLRDPGPSPIHPRQSRGENRLRETRRRTSLRGKLLRGLLRKTRIIRPQR